MKKSYFGRSVFLGIWLLLGNLLIVPSQDKGPVPIPQEICGSAIQGLQLCTTTQLISVKVGEDIILKVLLKNVSQENVPISVVGGNNTFRYDYVAVITDQNNNTIPRVIDVLNEKSKNNSITDDERLELFDRAVLTNGFPQIQMLAPGAKRIEELHLNHEFALIKAGQYRMTITRKILNRAVTGKQSLTFEKRLELPLDFKINIGIMPKDKS